MGNEQSRSDEDRTARRTKQSSGLTREEVNRMLEKQKKEYERKLQELNVRQATRSVPVATSQPTEIAREASDSNRRDIDQVIAQQVQDFVQLAYNNTSPTTGNVAQRSTPTVPPRTYPNPPEPSTSTSTGFERRQSQYSYTQEDLRNRNQSPKKVQSPSNLYPVLGTSDFNNANVEATVRPLNQTPGSSYDGFVFVNTKQSFQPQPSAPPLPTSARPTQIATSSKPNAQRQTSVPLLPTLTEARLFSPTTPFKPKPKKTDEDGYNCKTCGEPFGLNIFQCPQGHSSCKSCRMRQALCGVCKQSIGDTRNFTLEILIAERKSPCKNHADGCSLILKNVDLEAHLKECPFNDYECPLVTIFGVTRQRCTWRGKLSQMASHFDDVHPAHRQANVDTELNLINILDYNRIVHLINLSPYLFIVHLKVSEEDRNIYMTVQLLGTQMSASKWTYELHVYNKREPRRKYEYSDVCISNAVSVDDVFGVGKCAVLPQSYAMSYVNEGCLTYKFFIKRDSESLSSNPQSNFRGRGRGRGRGGRGRWVRADN